MLTYNTMRFGTDSFVVTGADDEPVIGTRQALLISSDTLDASDVTAVNSFNITGVQPAGTDRRILLKIDNKVYRFVNGTLTQYPEAITVDNVLKDGNTVDELLALSNISSLVGKVIATIIAISSANSSNPTVKIGINTTTNTEKKTHYYTSGWFSLPSPTGVTPVISEITPNTSTTGGGSVTVTARCRDAGGNWSEFDSLANLVGLEADKIQFKFFFSVNTVNSDSAAVNSVTVKYTANSNIVSGDESDIFSVIPNFETNLRLCYLVVRHKLLIDSTIDAFANFFQTPKHRERILVGNGTGDTATYTLGLNGIPDAQINHSSIKVFVDGVQSSDFDYNTETSEITLNAPDGKSILASYDYDYGSEIWHPMKAEFFQQPYFDGSYMTRFSFALDDDIDASVANIRIRLRRPSGSVKNQSLGKATGKTQQIVLPHVALTDSIQLNADFSYDFDTRVLTFVATKNTALKLSYDFRGEQHKIYSWAAGWAAA